MTTIAVVIVNYNTRDYLHRCLASIPTGEAEVIVVDNASPDGSAEMVAVEFPAVHLIANRVNSGFSTGNNDGLRWFGFGVELGDNAAPLARYALLLNPDTLVPPTSLAAMVRFMDERPQIGVAGPRLRRLDGSLDRACRRSFPTPQVSFYRMVGLSKLFPNSRRFNAYNMAFFAEDAVHPVDSVVGAFMLLRREAIAPDLRSGQTVLVVAHGNSLRALVAHLDHLSPDEVLGLNIPTGMPLHYELGADLSPVVRGGSYLEPGVAAAAAAAVAAEGH